MRILFLADNFPPEKNAQASRVYERACYWVRWGHQVTVLTGAPNFPEGKVYEGYQNRWFSREWMDGIEIVRVKTFMARNEGMVLRTLDFLSYMATATAGALCLRKPDVLVATSPQFFAGVAGYLVSALRRWPFVLEISDLWPASIVAVGAMRLSRPLRALEQVELFLYRRAVAIVALTASYREDMARRGIDPEKITVVRNGVDLERYAPRSRDTALAAAWQLTPEHFVVGYIGTLGMAHALENVLAAAERLQGTPVRFLLVGPGAERERLVALTAQRRLTNVVIPPPQPKEATPSWWSLCDLALVHLRNVPLFETVIPSKLFEAMAMGIPVVLAAPKGEASSIVEQEGVGVVVPPDNPDSLAAVVECLRNDPARREALRRACIAAAPRYSRRQQAEQMIEVLRYATGDLNRGKLASRERPQCA